MIPVVADLPCEAPGLGFKEYGEAIAEAICGGEPAQFTIGIYGPWGSGKSSLLYAVKQALEKQPDVIPVMFDAWRFERSDQIIVPLLYRIYERLNQSGTTPISDVLNKALKALLFSLTFRSDKIGFEISGKDLKDNWEGEWLAALDKAFSRPFVELQKLPKLLGRKRIVVLIDDLDRCSSDKVVAILESINLVMDVQGLIFVLALDYDVLVSAIQTKYSHVSGHAFIEKMIQIPFRVPALALEPGKFLGELIPNWGKIKAQFDKNFGAWVYQIATLGLDVNPRQIKRLINSVLLIQRIASIKAITIDTRIMAALIGVQLRWPLAFAEFHDAVLSNEPDPFEEFTGEEADEELRHYAEKLLQGSITNEQLRAILQFTAVVVAEDKPVQTGPAAEIREVNRARLAAELEKNGFFRKVSGSRHYYHKDMSRKFVLRKTVLRYEAIAGVESNLIQSFLITTQLPQALKAIEEGGQLAVKNPA